MKIAGLVTKVLRKYGQAMTLTRSVPGTFDPVTSSSTGDTETTYTVYGVTETYNMFGTGTSTSKAGTLIEAGDLKATIEAEVVAPQPGDTLMTMGVAWNVLGVSPAAPQGENIVFELHLRK